MLVLDFLNEPPQFSTEQLDALNRALEHVNLSPPVGSQTENIAGPGGLPQTGVATATLTSPKAELSNALPSNARLMSSVAQSGKYVFYTSNRLAARSAPGVAGSENWIYINPFAAMPDFGGEQDVIADPARGILVWYRQGVYNPSTNQNRFLLGVSSNGGGSFCTYSYRPIDLNSSLTSRSWDRPHLALTGKFLYVFENINLASGDLGTRVILRWPLDSLKDCSAFGFQYLDEAAAVLNPDFIQ